MRVPKQQIARFVREPRRKGLPMPAPRVPTPRVKYILSPSEIPAGRNYVLVTYGEKYEQTRHALGLTITVARQKSKTVSELSFLTAVHTAKTIGKQEGVSEILPANSFKVVRALPTHGTHKSSPPCLLTFS
jgi:hypothetical protein